MSFCLALASCGGDDDKEADPQPTTTSPSTESTTTTEPPAQTDEQALRQLAEDWYLVVRKVTYGELDLEAAGEFAAGTYLEALENDVREFQASGNRGERDDRTRSLVEDVKIDENSAVVTECLVDYDRLLDPSGGVLSDEVIATRFETAAERTADGWRFVDRDQLGDGTEGETCAAS